MASYEDPIVPSACSRVFEISELHEKILLKLPIQDLLLSQRVGKVWRTLVRTSLPISRALFLVPADCDNIKYLDWRYASHVAAKFGFLLINDSMDDRRQYEKPYPGTEKEMSTMPERYKCHWGRSRLDDDHRIFVNPLLAKIFPVLSRTGVHRHRSQEALPESMRDEKASWRCMSPFQPFVDALVVEGERGRAGNWRICVAARPSDCTGLLMDELLRHLNYVGDLAWIPGSEEFEEWNEVDDQGMSMGWNIVLPPPKRVTD